MNSRLWLETKLGWVQKATSRLRTWRTQRQKSLVRIHVMISLLGVSLFLSLSLSLSLKIFPVILLTIYHIFLIMLFVRIWSKVKQFSLVDIFLSSNQLSSRQCGDIARRIHLLIPLGSEWRVKAALNTLLWVLVGHTWSRFVWRGSEKNGKLC